MRGKKPSVEFIVVLAMVAMATLMTGTPAAGQTGKLLHSFSGSGNGGSDPLAGLIFDGAGNLYGTTHQGGAYGGGTAFELSPKASGGWVGKVLHSFGQGTDGFLPMSGLIIDAAGNLYGTTSAGGAHGGGTVFELMLKADGSRAEKLLYSFGVNPDGSEPWSGSLVADAAGNLYGTTYRGGTYNDGTVFELSPKAGGGWSETVLYSFDCNGVGGWGPTNGVIFDAAGNLYGTTVSCGGYLGGTVFKLTPAVSGNWSETVLYSFCSGGNGPEPSSGLVFDAAGNLYGTTNVGGAYESGSVFELTPTTGGTWTETTLHSFGNGTDGAYPFGGLIFDAAGNLYGTTSAGGRFSLANCTAGCGTTFELSPAAGGGWTEKTLHSFGNGTDGQTPYAGLVRDGLGNLYGTTEYGGTSSYGTVFEVVP